MQRGPCRVGDAGTETQEPALHAVPDASAQGAPSTQTASRGQNERNAEVAVSMNSSRCSRSRGAGRRGLRKRVHEPQHQAPAAGEGAGGHAAVGGPPGQAGESGWRHDGATEYRF